MRPFDREVDGVGTRVGINPRARGLNVDESWDKILTGTVLSLHDDRLSLVDFDRGQPLEGRNFAWETSYTVFDSDDEVNKVRAFNIEKDQLCSRVAVLGDDLPEGNDSKTFYYGTIREILRGTKQVEYVGVEFDKNIFGHSLDGKVDDGKGYRVPETKIFILSEDFKIEQPKSTSQGMSSALKGIMAELLLTNLSKTNSNRVNVVIEDLKSKVGEDWESEVRKSIEPEAAAEIFISLIKELEKQEQERLQYGSVQTPSTPASGRRGRPRKEKTPEPKLMPTTPEVSDVQNEDDLSALLDDLLNL